jgi:hypothetical protein
LWDLDVGPGAADWTSARAARVYRLVFDGEEVRSDSAELVITAEGVEFLESNYTINSQRRLEAGKKAS